MTKYMRRLKHGVALLSPLVMLCGAFILSGSTPAGADTTTFSSSTVGTSGTTPDFSENGPWSMSWEYDCSGSQGYFLVGINQPSDDASADIGPEEQGSGSSGEDYFYDTGQFSLEIDSGCSWSITVTPNAAAPVPAPVTYSSTQTGPTGSPPAFIVQGPWTMSWSYDCPSGGLEDEFFVEINEPTNDSNADFGPEETGSAGSGLEYFYDTGQFSLTVLSDCTWSITVSPSSVGALAAPVTYTSAQTGMSGNPQEFTVHGPWTMAWSDQCPTTDGGGFFDVAINEPSSDQSPDIGPFQSGTSGTGTDTYSDSGTFSLGVMSTCTWSISITSSAPTPTPTPSPTPTPTPTPAPAPRLRLRRAPDRPAPVNTGIGWSDPTAGSSRSVRPNSMAQRVQCTCSVQSSASPRPLMTEAIGSWHPMVESSPSAMPGSTAQSLVSVSPLRGRLLRSD